ncbi:MAG: VWA domain-containing protein [Candidatus Lambdaproteobacteria bacterium]|nr:VWA domain-containing protein [Candidatus Lambdaproteobacteria bacterium]
MPAPHPIFAGDEESAALAAATRDKVVGFCRLARRHGLRVGLRETQDAGRVAALFLVQDFGAFRDGLRALLCLAPDDVPLFERMFEGFWCPADPTRAIPAEPLPGRQPEPGGALALFTIGYTDEAEGQSREDAHAGASGQEVLRRVDFSQVQATDRRSLERLSQRLWQRMAVRLARRLSGPDGAQRLHLRRTWRKNLQHGGEPLYRVFKGSRRRKPRLVLLLDVSGSMELYSLMLLRFAHALQRRFRKVASFVFSTRLVEVTPALSGRRLEDALAAIAALRLGWSGGTRIGDCLATLVREHAGRLLRRDSILVVLSDGLDVGEPEPLAESLLAVRRRAGRIVWLNPLLGIEGYQPLARGMQAALPLVHVFAPAHNLESLLHLERLLAS